MGQVLHGSARITAAVRRAVQHSQESLQGLATRYRINRPAWISTSHIINQCCIMRKKILDSYTVGCRVTGPDSPRQLGPVTRPGSSEHFFAAYTAAGAVSNPAS